MFEKIIHAFRMEEEEDSFEEFEQDYYLDKSKESKENAPTRYGDYIEITREDGSTALVKHVGPVKTSKSSVKKRSNSGYKNPNINVYPNLKGYTGDVKTLKGRVVNDSGVMQPMYGTKPISDQSDQSNYANDSTDLIGDPEVMESIFNKKRFRHARRYSDQAEPHIRKIRIFGDIASIILLTSACVSTINLYDFRLQIFLYASTAAVAISTDAFKMCARYFAKPSRIIISAIIWMWCLAVFAKNREFFYVCSGLSILFSCMICMLNSYWIDSENWLFTAAVKQVIVNDPEGNPVSIWEDSGKREARTLASEIGIPVDDLSLDGLIKPFVCLGIAIVYKKLASEEALTRRLEKRLEKIDKKNSDLAKSILESSDTLKEYMEALKESEEENKDLSEEVHRLEKENADLRARIFSIQKEDLVKIEAIDTDEPAKEQDLEIEVIDIEEPAKKSTKKQQLQAQKEKAFRLFMVNDSITISEVMEATGLSRGTAYRVKEEVDEAKKRTEITIDTAAIA